MPNKITYTIKTADGKEHQVSKENIDKHGIQAYADAYEGATIRMRDSKKGDYDIPLANYNDAKAQGLHAFSWEHLPPKAQPQAKQQVAQKQSTQQVATTAPGTPMTATQKAQVLNNISGIVAQSQEAINETILKNKVALDRTKKPFSNINNITLGRKNSGSIGSDKVKEHTIDGKKVYSDDKGNIYDSENSAVSEVQERMIDRDGLSKRIAELSVENENANKRLNEIREKYQKQLTPTQIYGQNGTAGNFNALDKLLENDDEYMMLLTTTRNNQRSLDILRNKQQENNDKHNGVNVFGRSIKSLGRGMRDYFKTDFDPMGDATGKDALAYMRAEKIVETLSKKLQTGETLSTKEKATLALFNSYNQQQDISGDDNLSSWMYSGGRGVSLSAEFGAMIASGAGSFQTIAEKTAQGASKAALSQITKYLGKGVAKNIGTKIATKAVGSVAGMMSSGLAYTSTVGFKKTFANAMQNYVGEMGVTEDGQIAFGEYVKDKEGKVSFKRKDGGITDLVTAFAKAGYEQTKENGTEMLGETLPSITKILKGIGGTAKFVSKLEKIGATPFVESINKALRMTGYNGLPSQGIEEYAGLLSDVIFSDASLKDFGKLQTHLDIWGNVALTSGVMSSVQVAGIGTGAAMFYKYKHQNDKAGKKAQALIGDKWNGIQEVLDNTVNAEFSGALAGILSREDLNGEQKKRVVNYANSLLKMRGFNIGFNNDKMGRMASSGEKGIDGAISEVSYAAGYNATEDELANIKNELELRHRQLTETFKDDPSALQQIEEDPKAFLQGLKESEVGGEKAKVINAYEETRAAYDGMIQRVKDNIDDAITENNNVIEQRTHQDGNIYPATMKLDDRKVYVVGGNVQMNEDGKGIDHEKSSSSVMIRDAETGKIEMVDPSAILSVDTPVNAEEEKATSSEQIKQTYAQEQANKIDGVLEFKAGDTYSILGEDKKQHTIQIVGEAIDEKTKQPNPDMVMASIDGLEPTMLSKEQIQAMNNEENLWRLDQSLKQGEEVENTTPHSKQSYGYQKKITLTNGNGNLVRGEIVSGQNEDGRFEVQTEEPVNGKTVNHLTAEELDAMHAQIQEEQEESPALVAENATTQKEDVSGVNDGTIAENATVQKEETPQHQPTALERIPTNEQGEPIYEQADPETAWDAIVEQTEGDESIAQSVADGMVADMEAAVKRAEKAKVKGGTTIAEKIAAEKERVATIEQAKATLEHWKKIASTNSRRQEAIQAEESRKAKEAALLRKEQEEKERAIESEPKPIGKGIFGNIYNQFKGKAKEAVDFLMKKKDGVAKGALHYKGIGDIDLVWGDRKQGLSHIIEKHPDVADNLQTLLDDMHIKQHSDNRIVLESDTHKAVVSKMKGDETTDNWLLTAYEKKKSASASSSDIETEPKGKWNGTATPQNGLSSAGKVSESSNALQENVEKTSENEATRVETNPTEAQKEQLKSTQEKEADEQDLAYKKELEDFVASTDSNNRTKIDESKYDAEDLFAPLLLDGKSSNLAVMTLISDYIYDPIRQIAVYDYSFDIDNKTNSGWQKWGDLADEYNAHAAEVDKAWGENDNAMLEFRTVDAAVKFNDWLKAKEDGKSNVVHSFGNSASQNDTIIKLSDTSFAKMENGEQKAEREIGWLVDHNIRLEENSRKLDEIAHLLFDGDNIDSNRESTLREEAKKILEENEKLSRDYQKNYSDKYFGTDDITANYILQEANERLIALGVKPVKESYYFQSRKNEVAQNAVVQLLKRIGIPVHLISRVGAEVSGQGNSRGWTNGLDIWLTKDNINAETPVHEYTHIWTFALMKKNPKLWAEIKNLLKDSEWVDKIQSMDAYKYTLDNEDLLYSEVLSRISGERNGEKFESMAFKLIEEVNSVEKKVDLKRGLEKLRDALKRFWEWVGVNLFGMKEFKSVDDVCDRVLFDLLNASDIARTEEMREYYEEEREMNTIIDKAKEDGTYLKTPNGEDTKLPEKVWAYARTKKFKTQLSDRLNLILNESKEDFKDWEKEEFRDLFKKHDLLEENNEPGRFLVSQFMYSEKYYDRKGKMQEEAKETMNSGKGGENVSSVKSVDMRDAEYIKAVENNDTETIQRLLSEEAERKGYSNDSSYQGSLAFNGSAPYQNAYFETKEERKEAWENDEYEDTMSLGDYVDSGIDTNNLEWNLTDPMALRQADPERREAIENLRQTVRSNSKTITIYRAVDANIKENEIRNGDWVTPSRSYAEYHIGLQDWENGRIIEQEVSIDDLWWDGNDIAEWGYDNGKGEVYKNTPNNRKMFEVTYDDKGNIIPLSERFNEENDDIRYRYEEGDNDVALQVKQPIEQSKNLVALHNLSEEKLQQALELGGFPMPSIAITKANIGHTEFGNISLLFGKDSINPTDKRNKVYGGDAWTPTFPSIGYKLNSEKTSDIYRRANNVGSLPLFRPVFFHPDNYENKIDGQGSNGLVEHFKDDYGAKQMFLYEKGNAVEKFVQHEVEKYSDENVKFFEKILEIIGLEKLKNESYDSLENEMKKLLGQYYDIDFDTMKPFRVISRINSTIQKTIDYAENGNNKIENDIAATEEKIDERIDPKEFRKWLEKLFSGVVEKKGIRNEQDMFTPSGNRREWEKLYDAVTLDNAIKAMQTQAKKGGTGLFGGSIFGAASKELKEIEDIRNEAKLRINPISEEDYQAEKDRITERLKKVTIPSVSKSFSDAMDFVENVQDAVSKSHTAKGIYRHLHSLYPDMTMEVAKEIEDIVKDIQKISTRYLEAKPYRAVSFDEIKAAVVPSDTSSELIQQLKDRGIEVSTYEKDNQEQRKQIVNEVASKEELLFRNDEELEEVNQRFNEELENLTEENADKVTLWLGKPSDVLLSSGIENKPLKLYGNKVIKKMKKHGFALDELRDLPKAVADPIAVFDNLGRFGNRSILTELTTEQGNFLVTIDMGKGEKDVDFNIVSSVFGKGKSKIVSWIERGLATYINKKKALNYLHHSAPIAEALSNSRLSSAANIVKNFENPTNSSEKVLDRKTTQAEEVAEKERQQMVERANELAETLHLDNVEIVTDASTLEGKKAKAKGFYSTSTGKITIVIPNHSNIADVEKTLLHEAVAHHGLRKLFGEHFDNFLDNVFKNASEDVRREIVKLAAKNKWDFRIATEEYLASLAEDTNFEKMPNGLWDKVKRLFLDMLRSIGLLKQKDGELNDNELRYILWRSYKNLKEKGQSNSILNKAEDIAMQHRLKVGNYSESTDKEVRFRDGEPQSKERVSAAERYEQRVSRSMFQSQEALQDSMLGLKEAMDAIMRAEGKEMYMEDIEGFENAYLGENRLSSVNQAETEAFAHLVFKPMLDEVAKLAKNDKERSELTDYMMAKHGLERNEVMRKNALEEIVNNEKLSDAQKNARASIAEHRDYAGLTALTDANSVEEAESEARRMVEEYEQKHDTTNLWDKVNAVTKGILSKSYECGMMNKQTYEKVRDMYQFYIPLRGFDEETSREAYAYLSHGQSAFNAPIKTAKGRSSKADDPFANMQSMAESAIMQGNRNVLVKQKFLNFALNHPSDLVSVNALWLKYDDVKEEWRPVFPDNIEETDTADEVEKKIQDFEQRMTDLAKQDPERYKHGKDTENIPYRIVESRDLRQHQVVVKRNGRDYVLTINGNPRAAQALNGLTNPDNDVSGAIGAILNFGEKINRQLSAFYTTRNPDFVISNFIRDMLYANSIVWVKERPNYALRFHRNIGRCNPAQMKILLSKHKKGELDMNNSLEHMFHQFIMNGGETGYANVRDIEQHKNDIQRELKRANGKIGIKRSLSLLGEKLDEYNRAVENCARFAAFLTSREMGRTIDRSIYDAKDISVNFNKKGSGAKFMKATGQTKIGKTSAFISGIGRSGYVFWNAAIQGTTNFGRQFKRHPAKAFTASATMFILGALIAGMGMGDDGDDDKNSYWNLPESVRRSNILFRVGEQWVSIPLPVEYRSIYGMGELMVSAMSGKEHFTNSELGKAIAGQVTQILPIDFLEGEGGVKAFVPSAVKPFAEVISNKGWTGMPIYKDTPYNKNMPEWTKTYKSANKYLVGLAKTLNEVTGGDAYTKGSVNINPAQIEYLLNGYFGGVSNTIDKLTKSAETIAGKRDYDPKSFLLLNRVLKSGDERTEERAINREYYRLKEEYEILRDRLKNYENDTDNGVFDFSEKINFLYNSPEYARYEIFEDYREDIEGLYKELKDAMSDEERAEIEVELTGLKKQMIEEMNTTRK